MPPRKRASRARAPAKRPRKATRAKSRVLAGKPKAAGLRNTSTRFVPSVAHGALFRRNTDGSVAVMRLDEDEFFYTIDGIAAKAWMLIDGKRSLESIQGELLRQDKGVPAERLAKDLRKLVGALKKAKLIE